jgi:hypothetical protein
VYGLSSLKGLLSLMLLKHVAYTVMSALSGQRLKMKEHFRNEDTRNFLEIFKVKI